ncbi:hypothetical protein AVEN_102058-1 [Araneus ventricosus]|uniref:Uncharacterized protein n=1 Tax=Araneus ventricosus TaxID=182803 RepID=A0A4Y2TVN9_ARAVE|nr:hypothetical protein AVEN_102058-1 [Araneus ventricosus]
MKSESLFSHMGISSYNLIASLTTRFLPATPVEPGYVEDESEAMLPPRKDQDRFITAASAGIVSHKQPIWGGLPEKLERNFELAPDTKTIPNASLNETSDKYVPQ